MLKYLIALTLIISSTQAQAQYDCENPRSQMEMNICAGQDFLKAENELVNLIKTSLEGDELSPKAKTQLVESQDVFKSFRGSFCKFNGTYIAEGGSMEPMIVYGCMARLTRNQIKNLKDLFQIEF